MSSGSPSISTTTRSSDTRTSDSTSTTTTTKTTNLNYKELFDDVDWNEVNLIDIEREWRNELDQIEKVPALYFILFINTSIFSLG